MYYYDPSNNKEWVLMAEGMVDWRQSAFDVQLVNQTLELGLFSNQDSLDGVRLKVWSSPRDHMPTQWEALATLIDRSFELLPLPKPPRRAPDWTSHAGQCLQTLQSPIARHPLTKELKAPAFESFEVYRSMYARTNIFIELICQASIARSLHQASTKMVVKDKEDISRKMTRMVIPKFFRQDLGVFENAYPTGNSASRPGQMSFKNGDALCVVDTWYALSNLRDIIYLATAFPTEGLTALVSRAVSRWIAIATERDHVFPLFLAMATGEGYGNGLNVAASGLYAKVTLEAALLFPERADQLKEEAASALSTLRRFPLAQCFHQPELLAYAAQSAQALEVSSGQYAHWREDFLRMLLMMMYRDPPNVGLFQGCAGMMYPSFRESAASLAALAGFRQISTLPLGDICRLGLSACDRFIHKKGHLAGLPVEGIATKELPEAGDIGTAIYAAGGVFDLACMQSSLAR
jgi:hypothetical protein